MNKRIQGLIFVGLLAIPGITQSEENITKKAITHFYRYFSQVTIAPLIVLFSLPIPGDLHTNYRKINTKIDNTLSKAFDLQSCDWQEYDRSSSLGSKMFNVTSTAGLAAGVGCWYKVGEYISNMLCNTNSGRYIALVPVSCMALVALNYASRMVLYYYYDLYHYSKRIQVVPRANASKYLKK